MRDNSLLLVDQIQDIKIGNMGLYPMSHLVTPKYVFLYEICVSCISGEFRSFSIINFKTFLSFFIFLFFFFSSGRLYFDSSFKGVVCRAAEVIMEGA